MDTTQVVTLLDSLADVQELLTHPQAALEANATQTLDAMNQAALSVQGTSRNIDTLMQTKVASTIDALEKSTKEGEALIKKLEASVDRGDYDLKAIASPTVSELNELILQSRALSEEMETTLQQLRENPSDLLFKKSAPRPGPGE